MAYVSKETKAERAPAIKKVLAKYGVKGTISVRNYSSLVVTLQSGELDLIGDANEYNRRYAERTGQSVFVVKDYYQSSLTRVGPDYSVNPRVGQFFEELAVAMKGPDWYNNTDIQSDYFDIAYYLDVNIGRWDKPYVYNANDAAVAA
jgi:hypothetical protein